MQRLGIDVTSYSVLNLHQIQVDAPAQYVFEEILGWDGDSTCWPNHLARAERVGGGVEHIRIRPLGIARLPFGRRRAGWDVKPLFELDAIHLQTSPPDGEPDNARYMLYACSGGYPIGFFALYVRASIPDEGEVGTQVFLGVGFDFFGRQELSGLGPIGRSWEALHDRVTANVLNRFKDLCEWRFERTQAGH